MCHHRHSVFCHLLGVKWILLAGEDEVVRYNSAAEVVTRNAVENP
jgi:hypothetical protein